jgi:amidase
MTPDFQALPAAKRAEQLSLIPPEWRITYIPSVESAPNVLQYIRASNLLTPEELAITEAKDINETLQRISRGEISSLETTKAFAKRAALAQQLTNCCTEIIFDEAFASARKLDQYFALHGTTVGPLHGLPISVKDCIDVKGYDTTVGMYGRNLEQLLS